MRQPGIDFFRIIAIIAVIILHVRPFSRTMPGEILDQLARFGVPYFFIIAGYFFFLKVEINNDVFSRIVKYGYRLFFAYAFWYIIYTFWPLFSPDNWGNIAKNGFLSEFREEVILFFEEFKNHTIYYIGAGGRGGHLWFLPSLGLAILLLSISIGFNFFWGGVVSSVILFIMALLILPYRETMLGIHFEFDPRNGPFFSAIFVFIGAVMAKYKIKTSFSIALGITFLGLLLHMFEIFLLKKIYGIPLIRHDFVFGTIIYGTGVALLAFSMNNIALKSMVHFIGKFTLGIYGVHVLTISMLRSLNIFPSSDIIKILSCFTLSLILAKCLSFIPIIRKSVC